MLLPNVNRRFLRNESQKYKNLDFDVSSLFFESNNNKMIHSVPSPLLCDSPTGQIRGGNSKLVKRPSVDSGIHISCSVSSESSQNQRPKSTKFASGKDKLSRFAVSFRFPPSLRVFLLDSIEACHFR